MLEWVNFSEYREQPTKTLNADKSLSGALNGQNSNEHLTGSCTCDVVIYDFCRFSFRS